VNRRKPDAKRKADCDTGQQLPELFVDGPKPKPST
jgi:hypothetical protein